MAVIDQQIGKDVYIDIDIVFVDFKRSILFGKIRSKLSDVEKFTGAKITRLSIRPSSSGNAHIRLTFDREMQILENLCIRSWLHDDIWRLNLDLIRLLKTGDKNMVNRLWSGKYKAVNFEAEMKLCGNWEDVEINAIKPCDTAFIQAQTQEPRPASPEQKRLTDEELWAQWDETPDQSLPFTLPQSPECKEPDHLHCSPES